MGKTIPGTVKLTKKAYKDKYFGESTIFRWIGDLKERYLSTELAPKSGWPESIVNDQNANCVGNLERKIGEWHVRVLIVTNR